MKSKEITKDSNKRQFTGLKDKYDTDIYNGDTARGAFGIPPVSVTGEIFLKNGCYMMKTANANPKECTLKEAIDFLDIEIIS